jgi:GNAT superfamily N-acetyltransferase
VPQETTMNDHIVFRKIFARDLKTLVQIENESFLTEDRDFGVKAVSEEAWTKATLEEVLAEDNTRGWAILEDEHSERVIGYCIYEIEEEAYLIRRLLIHPKFRDQDIGRTLLHRLYQKIVYSETRKTLRAIIGDKDIFIPTYKWLAHMDFKSKVIRRGWDDDTDAIEFSFTTAEYIAKKDCTTNEGSES